MEIPSEDRKEVGVRRKRNLSAVKPDSHKSTENPALCDVIWTLNRSV